MKILIYVLSTSKCGTSRLSDSLHRIGIESYHELIQPSSLPWYMKWMKKRFTSHPELDPETAKLMLEKELIKYLEGDGYLADINNYLSPLYPIIDKMNIKTYSIHLTRNFYPHRERSYGTFKEVGIKIEEGSQYRGTIELTWSTNINWTDWKLMSQFERLCHYWTNINEFYLLGKRKIFHVEDFNNRSLEILDSLYHEATDSQKKIFKNSMYYEPARPENAEPLYTIKMNEEENNIYEKICGPTLKKLGYQ